MLQTYFDAVEHYQEVIELHVQGIGLDFVHDKGKNLSNLQEFGFPKDKVLGAGVIDGKNIWLSDLSKKNQLINTLTKTVAEDQIWLQPSCSLLHVPVTVRNETALTKEVQQALAFADEKLEEITLLVKGCNQGAEAIAEKVAANKLALQTLANSNARNHKDVQTGVEQAKSQTAGRQAPFKERYHKQQEFFKLPFLPSTTIGSFPQTAEVKQARGKFKRGEWTVKPI